MRCIAIILLLSIGKLSNAQTSLQEVQKRMIGESVGDISFTGYLLNEPADTSLRGKYKVLEFWATWCRPCLAAVPHINRLQQTFKDADSLVFLSVTYETMEKAAPTFEKVKFETIVVTDTLRNVHRQVGVQFQGTMALPRTVLLDPENRVMWIGSPKQLTAARLRWFLGLK